MLERSFCVSLAHETPDYADLTSSQKEGLLR